MQWRQFRSTPMRSVILAKVSVLKIAWEAWRFSRGDGNATEDPQPVQDERTVPYVPHAPLRDVPRFLPVAVVVIGQCCCCAAVRDVAGLGRRWNDVLDQSRRDVVDVARRAHPTGQIRICSQGSDIDLNRLAGIVDHLRVQ